MPLSPARTRPLSRSFSLSDCILPNLTLSHCFRRSKYPFATPKRPLNVLAFVPCGNPARIDTLAMRNFAQSAQALRELLAERMLVLDGAMGTMLQQRNLPAQDCGGASLEGCNENLVRTRPDVVLDIHRKYFDAGADIVETNTFGATPLVLAEYGLSADAQFLKRRAAELARQAAGEFSASGKPRFVGGSMGPTTKTITVTGGVTFEQLHESYYIQIGRASC